MEQREKTTWANYTPSTLFIPTRTQLFDSSSFAATTSKCSLCTCPYPLRSIFHPAARMLLWKSTSDHVTSIQSSLRVKSKVPTMAQKIIHDLVLWYFPDLIPRSLYFSHTGLFIVSHICEAPGSVLFHLLLPLLGTPLSQTAAPLTPSCLYWNVPFSIRGSLTSFFTTGNLHPPHPDNSILLCLFLSQECITLCHTISFAHGFVYCLYPPLECNL